LFLTRLMTRPRGRGPGSPRRSTTPPAAVSLRPPVEALEGRRLLANVSFAVIGDYGADTAGEAAVASLVKSWNPAFVATVGDNNYPSGEAATIDKHIGKHYHQFIAPYKGTYGAGPADGVNRFFPALGNHDWVAAGAAPYLNYFTLPGNERYYSVTRGPVQLFIIDSDPHEPDLGYTSAGTSTANSKMAQWLKAGLGASTARWQLVFMHHAPYSSSSSHGNSPHMQYPYQQWGADAVFAGHDHDYERIMKNGLPYFVNGLGGAEIRNTFKATPEAGSAVRYAADYGAMRVDASDTSITFRFVEKDGAEIDRYTLTQGVVTPPPPSGAPAAPSNLAAAALSGTQVRITWKDNATNETQYQIERSTDGRNFYKLAATGANGTGYTNGNLTPGKRYYYRVYAVNGSGRSAFSNVASAVTPTSGGTTTAPPPQPPPPQPPPPTSGVPAAPTGLSVSRSSTVAGALNVAWVDNATNETQYQIQRSTDGTNFYALAAGGANATFYRNTGLTAGKRYYYRVYALNAAGRSAFSNVGSAVAG
jgi:tartrate-resistant acid phosphatase type 5